MLLNDITVIGKETNNRLYQIFGSIGRDNRDLKKYFVQKTYGDAFSVDYF